MRGVPVPSPLTAIINTNGMGFVGLRGDSGKAGARGSAGFCGFAGGFKGRGKPFGRAQSGIAPSDVPFAVPAMKPPTTTNGRAKLPAAPATGKAEGIGGMRGKPIPGKNGTGIGRAAATGIPII